MKRSRIRKGEHNHLYVLNNLEAAEKAQIQGISSIATEAYQRYVEEQAEKVRSSWGFFSSLFN